ncbi:hypothetical protein M8C21_023666 [Ambrosia artemisiifolia]|uniref:Oleosin n=1 Tax=Ambrosia artemisiifolia TaxID=4212 RepID=A0AAD5CZA5_AMBAR|nr:hypothetical protein M8C21_023666 [Ambrosia artemisiifolia]
MTDVYHHRGQAMHHRQRNEPRVHTVVKAVTAASTGGSLLILSGLTLVGTVITLTMATPLLVIFSPVLVPAVITVFVLLTGLLTSGGFGLAAATVLSWMYRYVAGEHRTHEARHKIGSKGWERDQHATGKGHHATGGVQLTTSARKGLLES